MSGAPSTHEGPSTARDASPHPRRDGLVDFLLDATYYVKLLGEAALTDTPLSLLSSRMLATVLGEPGITVAEISRRIPKTQQMISHVAAQLGELGLVERRVGSGRGIGLYVTEAGRAAAATGLARERDLDQHLRELLGEARFEALGRLSEESRAILQGAL